MEGLIFGILQYFNSRFISAVPVLSEDRILLRPTSLFFCQEPT